MQKIIFTLSVIFLSWTLHAGDANDRKAIPHLKSGRDHLIKTPKELTADFLALSPEVQQYWQLECLKAIVPAEVLRTCQMGAIQAREFSATDKNMLGYRKYYSLAYDALYTLPPPIETEGLYDPKPCAVAALTEALRLLQNAQGEAPEMFRTEYYLMVADSARRLADLLVMIPSGTSEQIGSLTNLYRESRENARTALNDLPDPLKIAALLGALAAQTNQIVDSMDEGQLATMAVGHNIRGVFMISDELERLKEEALDYSVNLARHKLSTQPISQSVRENTLLRYEAQIRANFDASYQPFDVEKKRAIIKTQSPLLNVSSVRREGFEVNLGLSLTPEQFNFSRDMLLFYLGPQSLNDEQIRSRMTEVYNGYQSQLIFSPISLNGA